MEPDICGGNGETAGVNLKNKNYGEVERKQNLLFTAHAVVERTDIEGRHVSEIQSCYLIFGIWKEY